MADEKDEGVPEAGAQAVPAKALAPNWADGKIVVVSPITVSEGGGRAA